MGGAQRAHGHQRWGSWTQTEKAGWEGGPCGGLTCSPAQAHLRSKWAQQEVWRTIAEPRETGHHGALRAASGTGLMRTPTLPSAEAISTSFSRTRLLCSCLACLLVPNPHAMSQIRWTPGTCMTLVPNASFAKRAFCPALCVGQARGHPLRQPAQRRHQSSGFRYSPSSSVPRTRLRHPKLKGLPPD